MSEDEFIDINIFYDDYQGSFIPIKIKYRDIDKLIECLQKNYSIVYNYHGTFGTSDKQWVTIQVTKR